MLKEFTDVGGVRNVPQQKIAPRLKKAKKKLIFLIVFINYYTSSRSVVFKLKCFGPLAGLLATVPANPNNGASGSNVAGVSTGTSQGPGGFSEDQSIQEGTSRTGTQARWLTLLLFKM